MTTEADDLVDSARTAHRRKDVARLRAIAGETLALEVSAFQLTDIGIALRDNHVHDLSDALFRRASQKQPDLLFPRYELAVSLSMQTSHAAAIDELRAILHRFPGDARTSLLLARLYYLTDQAAKVESLVRPIEMSASNLRQFKLIHDFGQFLRDYPLARAEELIEQVERTYRPCPPDEVIAKILEAKAARAPFALLRLGDGEGSYTRLDLFDEVRFADLYADNRAQFFDYWFGSDASRYARHFADETRFLSSVITDADMLGVPHPSWVRHEYGIGSSRGISALVNIYRLLAKSSANQPGKRICSQMIHLDLGQSTLFKTLLDGENIGLISCFSQLPDRLRQSFGAASVDFYKLPGEQYFKDMIGDDATEGQHYPDVYERVMGDLVGNHRGKIFLVAGGILGKLYIHQIKRHGGIAIDIGSLADAWVQKATRPGYDNLQHLALA